MKLNNLLIIAILMLLPYWTWGQEGKKVVEIDLASPEYKSGFTIKEDGEYFITGTYPEDGVPTQNEYGSTKSVIYVAYNVTATITLENINISLTGEQCPFFARDAKDVTLILKGENSLSSKDNSSSPCLCVPEYENTKITIKNGQDEENPGKLVVSSTSDWPAIGGESYNEINIEGGIIEAIGGDNSSGIGAMDREHSYSSINITGGIVTAIGKGYGSGIGTWSMRGTILISGGIVTAISEDRGSGIGGFDMLGDNTITITGGIVNASSVNGIGIGGFHESEYNNTITITGGTVTASSTNGVGIGDIRYKSNAIFSTGDNGNAFISTISGKANLEDINATYDEADLKGIIFKKKEGKIYGKEVTLSTDAEIFKGNTLTIEEGQTLIIKEGVTLTNKGTIINNGKILIIDNGKIEGDIQNIQGNTATQIYTVTYNLNYDNAPKEEIVYVESTSKLSDYKQPTREYYEFIGWFDSAEDGNKVETVDKATTVYAHWKKNEIKIATPAQLSGRLRVELEPYELSTLLAEDSYKDITGYKWSNEDEEHYGLELSDNKIIGTPNKVVESKGSIKIIISGKNCEDKEVEIPVVIHKRLSIIDASIDVFNLTYSGKTAEITIPVLDKITSENIGNASLKFKVSNNEDTTPENSGADSKSGAPKFAGSYIITPLFPGNSDYKSTEGTTDFFLNISRKELVVTPKPDQNIFTNEAIEYNVSGAVNEEKPVFTGSLKADNGKVVQNDLALESTFARNYSFKIEEDVAITLIDNEAVQSLIRLVGTQNEEGAYLQTVTFNAPEGFLIGLESGTPLKSTVTYSKSFVWNTLGKYDIKYRLMRESNRHISDIFNTNVTVVKSEPDPIIPPVKVYHNINIPTIEGVTVDKGFGNHVVENWDNFTFTITIEEGYRMLSLPVVRVDNEEITFISSTDTTYTYRIRQIRSDKNIAITGIVQDPATSNNAIKPEVPCRVVGGVLYITVSEPSNLLVYDMMGRRILYRQLTPGTTPIYNLPKKILNFSLNNTGWKMRIE